ncbi:Ohr family peroxiredoxin [Xinfangfangia sp. D13-10-4-6]|uniref:Ohr family peroxiredoxin n=1 Tax=Pseudogemmobacter hezensis TaxID=2737662 RepID=UPI00155649E6|nr:Ohr family peroxiredoxin [Pseudogemmobacter hezensis]NPD14756.1 Ohr family peroxiredoxin [Pseudogemmobacter hezensis]
MTELKPPPVSLLDPYEGTEVLPVYTTSVTVTGGAAGHGRASGHALSDDGATDLALRLPKAMGGPGGGPNPEQLLAAGYAACFHGALGLIAMKRKIKLDPATSIRAEVSFGRDPEDGLYVLTAHVTATLPSLDRALAQELVTETEKICPYAKMARQGIRHETVLG